MTMRFILIVACCLVPDVARAQRTEQPLPPVRVVGPLPVTADSYPFGAADHARIPEDLKKVGYVEEGPPPPRGRGAGRGAPAPQGTTPAGRN
jgi:hypothetical protein